MPEVDPSSALQLWHRAVDARGRWLELAMSTEPADRETTESAITALYDLIGAPRPRFVWTPSPDAAARVAPPGTTTPAERSLRGTPASHAVDLRLASLVADLRERLGMRVTGEPFWWEPGPPADPLQELRAGRPPREVVASLVRRPLHRTVQDGLAAHLRAALPPSRGLTWYGQHDAAWVAELDVRRRLAGVRCSRDDGRQVDRWADLVRSSGWWWPREGVCVVAERPLRVRSETAGVNGERRLHCPDGPAVVYPDGWGVHVWHGTRVPSWAVEDPTPERIADEPNVEVRRCAIERMGWDAYVDAAGLTLVARADDPGNPGAELRLYDVPRGSRGSWGRLLLAVNGSVERDGTRRRYGLTVPRRLSDPVAAAGWTYGLTGAQYARLQRRT